MSNIEPIVPAIPSTLKHRNRKIILGCFRDYQEHTVADIVARIGISKLTVMRAIQFFCAKNIIVSSGKGSSTEQGGKKPEFFRFGYKKYLMTIMMWPETLGLTLFDMQMQEVCRSSYDWIIPSTPERAFTHHWLLDPICFGRFPDAAGTALDALASTVSEEDMAIIHTVPDIRGYNI